MHSHMPVHQFPTPVRFSFIRRTISNPAAPHTFNSLSTRVFVCVREIIMQCCDLYAFHARFIDNLEVYGCHDAG